MFEVLGHGGNAIVYRARQIALDRQVAIKISRQFVQSDRDRRRFRREIEAAVRLSGHPGVVALYDGGFLGDGRSYLVMDLCRESLAEPDGRAEKGVVEGPGLQVRHGGRVPGRARRHVARRASEEDRAKAA